MQNERELSPIDELSSAFLTQSLMTDDQDLVALFRYVAAAFRHGYLFIERTENGFEPLLEEINQPQSIASIERGFDKILTSTPDSPYFVRVDQRLYLERAWKFTQELERLYRRVSGTADDVDNQKAHIDLQALLAENRLLPEQAKAIEVALHNRLSSIWGGPGTGKTYTAGWLVKIFLEQYPSARVAISAPTGKATSNLATMIRRVTSAKIEAKTLHALLGLRRFGRKKDVQELPYDLIVVDESSMIDASLCIKLLEAVHTDARLVFLGDPYQLPPIEAGEPFCAFVEQHSASQLITTKRQESRAILDLAAFVKDGKANEAIDCLLCDQSGALQFMACDEEDFQEIEFVKPLYTDTQLTVDAFFVALLRLRLLCPKREGKFGTLAINQKLMQQIASLGFTDLEPIIITKNDYQLDLTNGQIGVISQKTAYFEDSTDASRLRKIPKVLLPPYETALCLSVHKSQGSEFDEVVLLLPEGSEVFGRKMLYTAITRAKKRLRIISSEKTLQSCIEQSSRRCTTFLGLS